MLFLSDEVAAAYAGIIVAALPALVRGGIIGCGSAVSVSSALFSRGLSPLNTPALACIPPSPSSLPPLAKFSPPPSSSPLAKSSPPSPSSPPPPTKFSPPPSPAVADLPIIDVSPVFVARLVVTYPTPATPTSCTALQGGLASTKVAGLTPVSCTLNASFPLKAFQVMNLTAPSVVGVAAPKAALDYLQGNLATLLGAMLLPCSATVQISIPGGGAYTSQPMSVAGIKCSAVRRHI